MSILLQETFFKFIIIIILVAENSTPRISYVVCSLFVHGFQFSNNKLSTHHISYVYIGIYVYIFFIYLKM